VAVVASMVAAADTAKHNWRSAERLPFGAAGLVWWRRFVSAAF
jgi:hypothetical protein